MPALSPVTRLEQALATVSPFAAAFEVARQFRDEGMSQPELYALYDAFRAQHEADADQTRYDAVLDTMDFISGWCVPSQALYPTDHPVA